MEHKLQLLDSQDRHEAVYRSMEKGEIKGKFVWLYYFYITQYSTVHYGTTQYSIKHPVVLAHVCVVTGN